MAKIVLDNIAGGHDLSKINDNFQKVSEALNEKVLFRENGAGEPNQMDTNLDMNGKKILNVESIGVNGNLKINGFDMQGALSDMQAVADKAASVAASVSMSEAMIVDSILAAQASEANAAASANSATLSKNAAAAAAAEVANSANATTVVTYSGTGSQTAYTLPFAPVGVHNVQVFLNGVYQQKNTYNVSGTTLTFSVAPPAGTNNIEAVISRTIPGTVVDSNNVTFIASGTGSVERTVQVKLRDNPTIRDFGAKGDQATDDSPSILLMAADKGIVVVPNGGHRISTGITIDRPLRFEKGGYFLIDAGVTVTISRSVESERQFIFRGDGTVSFTGEDSRYAHLSWFGALVSQSTDQAPAIQKATNAMGNLRESVLQADTGNYRMHSGVTLTRCCKLKGNGTRRTVFDVLFASGDVFTTSGEGVWIEGVQAEYRGPGDRTDGAFINFQHVNCRAVDIRIGSGTGAFFGGIRLGGVGCVAENVRGVAPFSGVGSYLVWVAASSCTVDEVYFGSTPGAPESLVLVRNDDASLSQFNVRRVFSIGPGSVVHVVSTVQNVLRGFISEVGGYASSGAAVRLLNSGAGQINRINISNVQALTTMDAGVEIVQSGAGSTSRILLSDIITESASGVILNRTAGTLSNIRISHSDLTSSATPINRIGSMTSIIIDPGSQPVARNPAVTFDAGNMANDTVYAVNLGADIFSAQLIVTGGHTNYGLFAIRAATSPGITPISVSANVNSTTGALTGTTGTVGKLTVSVAQGGLIYVENRTGGSQRCQVSVLTGIVQ